MYQKKFIWKEESEVWFLQVSDIDVDLGEIGCEDENWIELPKNVV
jgi:hypothetical protein